LLTHVSTLRQSLGDSVATSGSGWTLAHCGTDAERYLIAVRAGRAAAARGDAQDALHHFDEAIALWRGGPQLPDPARGAAEQRRWAEDHATLTEDRTDALLAIGHSATIVGDLEAAVADEPLRERRWGQLLLALYRAGRQGDALRAYQRVRTNLAEELGIEPGDDLRRLEALIVARDPSLDAPNRAAVASPSVSVRNTTRHETRYAKSGDLSIAYQVSGEGPIDVVCVPGLTSHVELFWEMPTIRHILERLGAFSRVVTFDKRGTGLADRTAGLPTLEERADDIRAVMDAAGFERAALFGLSEGGQAAIYFAATYPDRVTQLILHSTSSGLTLYPEDEQASALATLEFYVDAVEQLWGQGYTLKMLSGNDEAIDLEDTARFERNSATPHAAADVLRRSVIGDATAALPAISAPTLVISRTDDPIIPEGTGPLLAAAIADARYVELPGAFHLEPRPDLADDALDEVEEFLTGLPSVGAVDRVLATVMFTDIVGSPARAAAMTDPKSRQLLDGHDSAVRQEIERHRGREIKTTGDGFLVSFDGPARAVRCAAAAAARARALGLEIRAGVHTGEVEMRGDDIAGIAVHIGARVVAMAAPDEVLVTSTVRDLTIGSGLDFADAGLHVLEGVPGEWRILRLRQVMQ
jgi:class 3 adenylate cyclase/DNA-binding SARP family transcriptional activator